MLLKPCNRHLLVEPFEEEAIEEKLLKILKEDIELQTGERRGKV